MVVLRSVRVGIVSLAPDFLPAAMSSSLRGEDITVYGDGAQSRSFCYVDDLIDGLIALMDSPGSLADPVNLGS